MRALASKFSSTSLRDVKWVGFDLDHALVRYRNENLMPMIYTALTEFLVTHKGYPADVLRQPYDPTFCAKGVLLDYKTGNFFTLDSEGRVVRASHGTRAFMTPEQLEVAWPGRVWNHVDVLRQHTKHDSVFVFITYFDIPAILICARLVDHCDKTGVPYAFTDDLFAAFNYTFDPEAFEIGRGLYFPSLLAEPDKYLYPRVEVKAWLKEQQRVGRRFFLATNSHVGYGTFLLRHCFGEDWRDLFFLSVFNAKKPAFFHTRAAQPFYLFDSASRTEGSVAVHVHTPHSGPELCQGNADTVQALVNHLSKAPPTPEAGAAARATLTEEGHVVGVEALAGGASGGPGARAPEPEPVIAHAPLEPAHPVAAGLIDALEDPGVGKEEVSAEVSVAYVGDHLHGDVLAAHSRGWHAIAIVEEMESFACPGGHCELLPGLTPCSSEPTTASAPPVSRWGDFFSAPVDGGGGAPGQLTYFADLLKRTRCTAVSDTALLPGVFDLE